MSVTIIQCPLEPCELCGICYFNKKLAAENDIQPRTKCYNRVDYTVEFSSKCGKVDWTWKVALVTRVCVATDVHL